MFFQMWCKLGALIRFSRFLRHVFLVIFSHMYLWFSWKKLNFWKWKFFWQKFEKSTVFWHIFVLILGQEDHCILAVFRPPFLRGHFFGTFTRWDVKNEDLKILGQKGTPYWFFSLFPVFDRFIEGRCEEKNWKNGLFFWLIFRFRYPGSLVPENRFFCCAQVVCRCAPWAGSL